MDNTQETPIAAEEGSIEQPESTRLYPRWMIRHAGLNRKERHRLARVARTGLPGLQSKTDARKMLQATPANYPVRKVHIDGRITYIFEPQHQGGMQAFREVVVDELKLQTEEPSKEKLLEIRIKASRAYITKVNAMLTENAAKIKESIQESVKQLTPETPETANV
jgi:hypothetical protein